MKFRLSVQPKPREPKSIVPSHLLSDPAFSPDPHLNPYFTADQELAWAPPQGHPVLKHRNRGPVANFALRNDIIASADFDFQLLQPPNSPVSYIGSSGTKEPSPFPFPSASALRSTASVDNPALNTSAPFAPISPTTALPSLNPRSATPVTAPAAPTTTISPPQPPAAKKKRMLFLTRRKSTQLAPTPSSAPTSSTSKIVSLNDVTRPIAPRLISEPVTAAASAKRPLLAPRSATAGTDTPRSTAASSLSAASKRDGKLRLKDLDRIDELDETSPWGISLHHGGPYEAAVQALKRGGPSGFTGSSGTTLVNEYHTAYGQPYVPPQVPTGVSLNLVPGQILPRNFGEQRPTPAPIHPRPRDTSALPPRMQQAHPQPHPALSRSQSHASSSQTSLIPPRHMNRMRSPPDGQSEPLRYRRQSQPVPPSTFSPQLLNLHSEMHLEPRADALSDLTFSRRQSQVYQQPPLVPNSQPVVSPAPPSNTSQQPIPDFQNSQNTSRRQSQILPPSSKPFYSIPPSISHSVASDETLVDEPENASDQPPNEAISFNIGMAMLQPEASRSELSISTPRIFLPPGTPDNEKDFDPYDPIHLNNEHSRSPSLVALYTPSSRSSHSHSSHSHSSHSHESFRGSSRIPSPDHSLESTYPEPTQAFRPPETAAGQQETSKRSSIDLPPYALISSEVANAAFVDDRAQSQRQSSHFRSQAQTSTSSRNSSPAPSRGSALSRKSTLSIPSESSHGSHGSHNSHRSRRESQMMQVVTSEDIPAVGQNHWHIPENHNQPQVRPVSIAVQDSFNQNAHPIANQEQQNGSPGRQIVLPPPPPPPVRSGERLVSPPPSNYAKSTHPSLSTYSSSQARNGPPPPNRYLPKRLVMPAPLNNSNALNNTNGSGLNGLVSPPSRLSLLPQSYTPPRQTPPRQVQVSFQPQAQVYYNPPVHPLASKPRTPPIQQVQEIHTAAAVRGKLKKRASVVPPASVVHIPPAHVISTVSFAPPVIGFGQNTSVDKASLSRAKTEKIPKRVLSKRRTDL